MNDFWNDRYAGADGYLFGTAPALFLTENPWVLAGAGRALCVADGEGRNSVEVARAGWQVTAFDLSPVAVDRARALAREAGVAVDTRVDDLENDAWADGSFDLVLGIFVQVFGDERKLPLLHRIGRAVKPGGRLALHGYRPEQLAFGTGGPPSAANMYTEDELRAVFEGWQIERLAGYDREVQEGRGHSGMSALIDLVARKPLG